MKSGIHVSLALVLIGVLAAPLWAGYQPVNLIRIQAVNDPFAGGCDLAYGSYSAPVEEIRTVRQVRFQSFRESAAFRLRVKQRQRLAPVRNVRQVDVIRVQRISGY